MKPLLLVSTYVLSIWWPQGQFEQVPATTQQVCQVGAEAATRGLMFGPGGIRQKALDASCEPGNLFEPGWDCIQGYNCTNHQ